MSFSYMVTSTRVRYLAGACISGTLLAAAGLSYAVGGANRVVDPPDASELATLRRETIEFAARNGEPSPTKLRLVTGTRRQVVAALMGGSIVDSDQDVFAVAMEGDFVGYAASRSPRHPEPPTGRYMLIVYDATTLKIWDWSLTREPAPIGVLAPLISIGT